ncbi:MULTISPECIES: hypothetical protein [Bacillaceae]|uniref:DUF2802 domain-containing protein n=1 Tax=Metabacillus sediminis TaxID=3117746 RepID=A0ABZ2NE50_9BACI|nr:hypothetical protein [Bacillus sp. SJS]KZZ86323.1 hypothetical protein AS29_001760 [Bacillus sp. SJS]
MEIVIVVLLVAAIALLVYSFTKKDKVQEIEKDLDQLQLSAMQEIYKLKKKIKVLEEEILQDDIQSLSQEEQLDYHIEKKVVAKYKHGMTVDAIAKSENISVKQVQAIIKRNERILT